MRPAAGTDLLPTFRTAFRWAASLGLALGLACGGGGGSTPPPEMAPQITVQPQAATGRVGQTATFAVTATGTPDPAYTWQVSLDGSTWSPVSGGSGAASSQYTTHTLAQADQGARYQVIVSNSKGTLPSEAALLTVQWAPSITTQPVDQTVQSGTQATFTAAASGFPTPTCLWQRSVDGGTTWTNLAETSPTLTFAAALADDGSRYRASFTNAVDVQATAAALLHVTALPPQTPVITPPASATANATGLQASVPAQAGCSYAWTVTGGTLTAGQNTPQITFTAGAAGTLHLDCTVTNGAALSAAAATVNVTVSPVPVITAFAATPATITQGHGSILSWTTTGTVSRTIDQGVGDVTSRTTVNVTPPASLTYTLTAQNAAGAQVTAPAAVRVVPPATITSFQASPATIAVGQSANLTGVFSGTSATVAGVGAVTSGTPVAVTPGSTTTYTLSVLNEAGDPTTGTTTVTVTGGTLKVLFDHTKHEEAGSSAYWVICSASEPDPSPANPTSESDWNGGISRWAYDLYKQNWKVQTLPQSGGRITYGDASNPQDLSNYNVFIIPECYILFTATEKQAVYNYVINGGGLFLVGNHIGAIRYTGGTDAVGVFNDLLSIPGVNGGNSWTGWNYVAGHAFDTSGYRNTTSNVFSTATGAGENAIIRGPNGTLSVMDFHDYSYLSLNTGYNPTVREILHTQVPGETGSFSAFAYVGAGRVVTITDSSPSDDGTASGHSLIDGYGVNSNRAFFLNATAWLANGGKSN